MFQTRNVSPNVVLRNKKKKKIDYLKLYNMEDVGRDFIL